MSNYPSGPGYPPPPGAMGPAPGGVSPPPPNHLVWAILSTFFCCLPLGIVSIVYAAQVNSKWFMGDHAGALDSSAKAKQFAIWSVVAFFAVGALYLVAVFAGLVSFASLGQF